MSELRKRMNDAMVLRCLAERTKESYLACVTGLAKYYWLSPDTLDAEAIQAYLLPLITEKKLAYSSVNQAACAFRFLFATVLRQKSVAFDIPMATGGSARPGSPRPGSGVTKAGQAGVRSNITTQDEKMLRLAYG